MVDALREARRVLRRGGLLIDARPDSRVLVRVEHAGRIVGRVHTQTVELHNDAASDRAVARAKRERMLRRVRAGRFWYRIPFADRAELDAYLAEHVRFEHRACWIASRHALSRWRGDPFVLIRAIRFEVLAGGSALLAERLETCR